MSQQVKVTLYGATVGGFLKQKKDTEAIRNLFHIKKVTYDLAEVDQNEEMKKKMQEVSGKREIPQVHIDDKYFGGLDAVQDLIEDGSFSTVFH